jgi:hypothetical protein
MTAMIDFTLKADGPQSATFGHSHCEGRSGCFWPKAAGRLSAAMPTMQTFNPHLGMVPVRLSKPLRHEELDSYFVAVQLHRAESPHKYGSNSWRLTKSPATRLMTLTSIAGFKGLADRIGGTRSTTSSASSNSIITIFGSRFTVSASM